MRIIKFLNDYFIADPGEDIPISDYFWFYGSLIVGLIFFIIFASKAITS